MNTIATISGNKCFLSEITKINSRIQLDFKCVYMIWYFLLSLVVFQYHGKVLSVSECFDFPKVSLRFQSTKLERSP